MADRNEDTEINILTKQCRNKKRQLKLIKNKIKPRFPPDKEKRPERKREKERERERGKD